MSKAKPNPVVMTPRQVAAAEKSKALDDLAEQNNAVKARAAQLAQVVNLVIAGHSFEEIGAAIGASADEVESMVTNGAERYVRTQPALRVWVRNWLSEKYVTMIEADWAQASDPMHPEKLEHQDRVMRMLGPMARLHGAEAPTQSEVKVEHSADAVEEMVRRLSTKAGQGYDASVFDSDDGTDDDIVDADVVHDAAAQSLAALEAAADAVRMPTDDEIENGDAL